MIIGILIQSAAWYNPVKQRRAQLVIERVISMSISGDSLSDETLNRGPWCCACGDSMNFLFVIYKVQFSLFFNYLTVMGEACQTKFKVGAFRRYERGYCQGNFLLAGGDRLSLL